MNKTLLTIIVVVVLVIIAGGVYFFAVQNNTGQTDNQSGTDFFIGLTVSLVMLASSWSLVSLVPILAGVAGGVLPDFLQFVYFQIKKEPLTSLEHFHVWIHTKNRMKGLAFLSFASQAVLVLTVFCISRYF